jgi:hypothetical protein
MQLPGVPFPDILLPVGEYVANYNSFTKRPIIDKGLERLPAEYQYGPHTSILAKEIGGITGLSPTKLDHLVTGYFAGLGRMGLYASDLVLARALALEVPPPPAKRVGDLPMIRGFVSDSYSPGKYVDYFYNGVTKAEQAIAAPRDLVRGRDVVKSAEFKKSGHDKLLWYATPLDNKGTTRISVIREAVAAMNSKAKSMALVRNDMEIKSEEKRERLINLKDQRDRIAERHMIFLHPDDR